MTSEVLHSQMVFNLGLATIVYIHRTRLHAACMVISLLKTPYVHCIHTHVCMILASLV